MTEAIVNTVTPRAVLDSYEQFRSDDIEEVRTQAGRVFCEHELVVVGKSQRWIPGFATAARDSSVSAACITVPQ